MKKVLLICLLIGLFFGQGLAQEFSSPYALSKKTDFSLLATGLAFELASFPISSGVSPLTTNEINMLSAQDVNGLDRFVTSNYSRDLANVSNIFQFTTLFFPLTLLAPVKCRNDFGTIGLMSFEALLLTHGVTRFFKASFPRIRPFVYNPDVEISEKLKLNAKKSFFSGHTSNYTAMSFFTAKIISDYFENKTLKIIAWSTAASTSVLMAYLRVQSGKHFVSDVIVGYAVGAAIGYLIPHMHKKKSSSKNVSLKPFGGFDTFGMQLTIDLGRSR